MRFSKLILGVLAAWLLALVPSPAVAQISRAITGELTATSICQPLDVEGFGSATYELTGTWSGTVTIYKTGRNGTRSTVTTKTSNTIGEATVAGYKLLELCFTTATSGKVVVSLIAAGGGGSATITGGAGDASASKQDEQTALLTSLHSDADGLEGGIGAAADAAATQGSTGSLSAKLRTITSQLNTLNST